LVEPCVTSITAMKAHQSKNLDDRLSRRRKCLRERLRRITSNESSVGVLLRPLLLEFSHVTNRTLDLRGNGSKDIPVGCFERRLLGPKKLVDEVGDVRADFVVTTRLDHDPVAGAEPEAYLA